MSGFSPSHVTFRACLGSGIFPGCHQPPRTGSDENRRCTTLDETTRLPASAGPDPVDPVRPAPDRSGAPSSDGRPRGAHRPATDRPEAEPASGPAPDTPRPAPDTHAAPGPGPGRPRYTAPRAAAPAGVLAVLRLAVVSLDADGRISHWNRGAEELFGHRWEAVFGQRPAGLLSTAAPGGSGGRGAPRRDVFEMLGELTLPCWTGEFTVAGRGGMTREGLWWTYRIGEGDGRGLLVLAVNAKPLRAGSLRIAIGDRMLPYTLLGATGPEQVRIAPRLAPPADGPSPGSAAPGSAAPGSAAPGAGRSGTAAIADRLTAVLPHVNRQRLERVMDEVARLGSPVLEVEGAALPVLPYEAVPSCAASALPGAPGAVTGAGAETHGWARTGAQRQLPPPAGAYDTRQPAGHAGTAPSGTPRADAAPHGSLGEPHHHGRHGEPPHGATGYGTATRRDPADQDPGQPAAARPRLPHPGGPRPAAAGALAAGPVPPTGLTRIRPFASAAPGHVVQQQLALLRETGNRVGTTLELDTTASELCQVAVPGFADLAAVMIVDDVFTGAAPDPDRGARPGRGAPLTMRRVAVACRNARTRWEDLLPEDELFTVSARDPRDLTEPLLLPVVDPVVADAVAADLGVPAIGPLLADRSLLIAPLTARGTVLGRMCFVREPQRPAFNLKDAATAVEFAARGAVHLDNARLHQFESRAATTLQRSMLPTSPPRIPGVSVAHHYRPGDRQAQVGGDWFDAIQLPGGRVALIVGDVMGHGLHSAAVMGQFRTAVQTMAALDLPPAQLLRHLDNLAHRLGADHLATCVYAVYDAIHRTLHLANAGHIPPVLARPDGRSELLRIPEGAPIGVGGVPFETVEIPVPDGSWLVLCTDGLVEVRGQGIDAGLAALCANVIEPRHSPEGVCDRILSRVHSDDRRDDVALLVARFDGIAADDVAEWRLALEPGQVRTARTVTRGQLARWGLEGLTDLAELLVSELVTNALRAARQEVRLRLMRVGKLLVEVSDDDHNLPQLRRADQDDEHGRGLALVSNLSRRWGTSRKAVGKVVWFELPLPKE